MDEFVEGVAKGVGGAMDIVADAIDLESEECCCPFALTDASDIVQNYGCLPTPIEIIYMRVVHGKTWACHREPSKPCVGAIRALAACGLPCSVDDPELVTEQTNWGEFVGTQEEVLQPCSHLNMVQSAIRVEQVEVAAEDREIVAQALDHQFETVLFVLDAHFVDCTSVTKILNHDNKRIKIRMYQPSPSIVVVNHIEVMQFAG